MVSRKYLIKFVFFILFYFMYMDIAYRYIFTACVCTSHEYQKREPDPLGLEL